MKRIGYWLAMMILLVAVGQVQAVVTNAVGNDNGNGAFSGLNFSGNQIDLSKEYDLIGDMFLISAVNTGGLYTLFENITNNTGIDWTDFHWELDEEFGDVTFVNVDTGGAFPNVSFANGNTVAWADGGIVPAGSTFVATVTLGVANPNGGLFLVQQLPTITIPEPLTATFGLLSLAALSTATNRRRTS